MKYRIVNDEVNLYTVQHYTKNIWGSYRWKDCPVYYTGGWGDSTPQSIFSSVDEAKKRLKEYIEYINHVETVVAIYDKNGYDNNGECLKGVEP